MKTKQDDILEEIKRRREALNRFPKPPARNGSGPRRSAASGRFNRQQVRVAHAALKNAQQTLSVQAECARRGILTAKAARLMENAINRDMARAADRPFSDGYDMALWLREAK